MHFVYIYQLSLAFICLFELLIHLLGIKLRGVAHAAKNYQIIIEENRRLYNEVQELKGINFEIVFWRQDIEINLWCQDIETWLALGTKIVESQNHRFLTLNFYNYKNNCWGTIPRRT